MHDNHNLHVASMGCWATWFVEDDSVRRCGRMPDDIVEINRPRRFDRTPNHDLVVRQLSKPRGVFVPFDGNPLAIGDDFFRPGRITAKAGERHLALRRQPAAQRDRRQRPRGFSSVYWGRTRGTYTVTPRVKGTYRLVCLVHPTTMAQTLEVK